MIIEDNVSENEMVLEFLKSEIRPLIEDANLSDGDGNRRRANLLDCLRGYQRRTSLFQNFPVDAKWRRLSLGTRDLAHVKYLNSSTWRSLAGRELRVVDGAARIVDRSFDRTIPNIDKCVAHVRAIAQSICEGRDLPALILADLGDGTAVVIEGNHRATAYVIAGVECPISALSGSSTGMAAWASQCWS
jgi:hypothetical protein